jgi:acetylglutamate/LysW-gamma-L-alpha-aminoadipate kinase
LEGKKKSVLTIIEDGKKKVLRGDNTGKVENVNVDLLKILLNNGYLPVIAPLSSSYEGEAINVDGDRASALIAVKLNADKLIILSNVPGLLEDVKDESTLIKHIEKDKINEFMEYAKRRMKKKVMGAEEAIKGGVREIVFADARIKNPITNAINGKGTVIN